MKIKLDNQQIQCAINTLDFYSRIWIGQYDHINWEWRFSAAASAGNDENWRVVERNEQVREILFTQLRDITMPDLVGIGLNGSRGIWNFDKNDPRAIDAYDLQQCIRHDDSWHRIPEGGWTRNFDKPWIRGRYPAPVITIDGNKEKYVMVIDLTDDQANIMLDAAKIYVHMTKGELAEMFKYYTNNSEALKLAKDAENYNIEISKDHIDRYEQYLNALRKEIE